MSAILPALLLFGIIIGPQFYNTYYANENKLWKTLFLPGLVYSTNMKRERRKFYFKIYFGILVLGIIIGLIGNPFS